MSYTNPIIPGFNPDPSIVRVEHDFFLVTSTFEYFPGAPIYHSRDLIQWTLIGHALTRPSQLQIHTPEPGGGVWATTIRHHQGVFYVITASFQRYRPQQDDRVWPQGFYVQTSNIWDESTWSDPVYFDQVGFDQDLFWDDDGTVYLSSTYRKLEPTPGVKLKDFAIHICTVDLATGHSTSEPKLIRDSSSGVAEGSHIFKRGRYYYLFTAEGGTESGHCEWVSRSEKGPMGPWELGPSNPLWHNSVQDEVQNTGHVDLVEDAKGQWWAVLLAVRPVQKAEGWEESVLGRETFLVPVTWMDEWPVINEGKKITLQSSGPGLYQFTMPVSWRDDFSQPRMQLGWYRKNTPSTMDYTLTERPSHLRLYGGPYNLSVPACPTLFLRKQTHRYCRWETKLSFHPTSEHTEAGTVLWWNYFTHSSIGIRKKGGHRVIHFQPSEGDTSQKTLGDTEYVTLFIECGNEYRFGYREPTDSDVHWIGIVTNRAATKAPPVGAPFTGMMLGLYTFGERQRCLTPADFAYAQFQAYVTMTESPQSTTKEPLLASDQNVKPADDWAGTTDPAERRRRQNRINQRAHRRRQRMEAKKDTHPKSVVPAPSPPSLSTALVRSTKQANTATGQPVKAEPGCTSPGFNQFLLDKFAEAAFYSYMVRQPTADHLLTLARVNVFRAFGHNLQLVGGSLDNMHDDALSPFNTNTADGTLIPKEYNELPLNLRPTKLQRTVAHHPWLDFFPLPKMRDNLIQAGDDWNDDQLCHDIMGFWDSTAADAGLLVWGEPWDVRNWEVTEPFLKKWQWVIRGCPELMNATNAWRAKRGEKLIFRYL
ncbi:Concanavalin A-like lectin/glucanase subgroup [Penicillium hispanicum]|uniref:Concanavalin A-like lectin/glucanase subgroup n=1 Tax=Penicillium hispanicum TaxID=1080232 RepID=UPI002541E009|nr:Concanavalin A-like lectin/glucanase subgroup [Penicillium hispanicum]KAJ5577461.1 Concanavalin A-like lectin/glucanase subgroup [Penicillium hispanicum]